MLPRLGRFALSSHASNWSRSWRIIAWYRARISPSTSRSPPISQVSSGSSRFISHLDPSCHTPSAAPARSAHPDRFRERREYSLGFHSTQRNGDISIEIHRVVPLLVG